MRAAAVLLVVGLAVTTAVPRVLPRGSWWVRRPHVALVTWHGAFLLGVALSVAAAVAAVASLWSARSQAQTVGEALVGEAALTAIGLLVIAVLSVVLARSEQLVGRARGEREVMGWLACTGEERADLEVPGCRVVLIPSEHAVACCMVGDRARVFLTDAMIAGLDVAQVRSVVLHEHAHRLLGHHALCLVADLAEHWTPWLPAARELRRATSLLVELAADDYARHHAGAGPTASALATLAERFPEQSFGARADRLGRAA